MIKKMCPRCQQVMPYDKKICDRCEEKVGSYRRDRDKIYQDSRRDKEYQAIYKDRRWKMARAKALARAKGLCEECIAKGRVSYVDDVHHKIPIKVDITKAFDVNNLICLCRSCHIEAHRKI